MLAIKIIKATKFNLKINSFSNHPTGHEIVSAAWDCTITSTSIVLLIDTLNSERVQIYIVICHIAIYADWWRPEYTPNSGMKDWEYNTQFLDDAAIEIIGHFLVLHGYINSAIWNVRWSFFKSLSVVLDQLSSFWVTNLDMRPALILLVAGVLTIAEGWYVNLLAAITPQHN